VNPNSLRTRRAFIEPHIIQATAGQHFQFQRIGYFNLDRDTRAEHLVFNKTVGLRDAWAKSLPKQPASFLSAPISKRKPIDLIKQLGKKYTNLPEDKQQKVKAEIQQLANEVSYEDLEPLFGTAAKKVGTRIAVAIALKVLISKGQELNTQAEEFILAAKTDKNPLLSKEA
jgi:glutaminyl-tRNA synthetase